MKVTCCVTQKAPPVLRVIEGLYLSREIGAPSGRQGSSMGPALLGRPCLPPGGIQGRGGNGPVGAREACKYGVGLCMARY